NKVYYKPTTWNNCSTISDPCEKLKKTPFVCNGCKARSGCRRERLTYYARKADDSYKELITNCRQGISLTNEEIYNINQVITPLIKKGQTTNHLYINHPEVLDFSKSSFYRYINDGVFEFKPLDFPRIVKYKKRKNKKRRTRQEREILTNRKYEDFIEFTTKSPELNIVEMDTVEGIETDSKCILTLFWRKSNFMLMFLLENQTTSEVTKVFQYLQETLSEDDYKQLFQIILTDNGHEFYDVNNIEYNHRTGEYISHLFFCDPGASYQKGGIEKNHEFIRYVLPKKTTFENLTQNDCNIIANHINSLCRESLNNNCPFKAMLFICNEHILNTLNMYYIKPDEVQLNKKLIK
ncbi:MAG: IS30 family transposase, partial [Bacilli bacterium]